MKICKTYPELSLQEIVKLRTACITGLPSHAAEVALNIPDVKNLLMLHFLKEINEVAKSLCV